MSVYDVCVSSDRVVSVGGNSGCKHDCMDNDAVDSAQQRCTLCPPRSRLRQDKRLAEMHCGNSYEICSVCVCLIFVGIHRFLVVFRIFLKDNMSTVPGSKWSRRNFVSVAAVVRFLE